MSPPAGEDDPLPSWNEGPAKESITRFVEQVTNERSQDFVPPEDRIAVFDNDGTLCSEMPVLTQFSFTVDLLRSLAPDHPEWETTSPFREAIAGDMAGALSCGLGAITTAVATVYAGMTTDEFERDVTAWMDSARHPETGRRYTEMVYQPMVELIAYLEGHRFRSYIVSATGIDFMRPWTGAVYGIPPEHVIGSNIRLKYEVREGRPVLVSLPFIEHFDEGEEKPAAIHHFTGRRPILAFGNSDGDLPMLEWVASGPGPRFAGLVIHTDAAREWAYTAYHPDLTIGRLDRALTRARERGWTVVDMKRDWRRVFSGAAGQDGPG